MGHGAWGVADCLRARVAGWRDGKARLVGCDEASGRAQSGFLAAERARAAEEVDRAVACRIVQIERAELELGTLRGVYARALGMLPDEEATAAAEQARREALAALTAYRSALDAIWAVADERGRRYERLGHTYLRLAKMPAGSLTPCEAPAQLNAFEGRYAALRKLVDEGYFDRHYA